MSSAQDAAAPASVETPPVVHARRAPLTRWDLALCAAIALLSLALYLRTLYPGLLPGDSGEFQVLARLLGTAHPTGYPVYLLLAHPLSSAPLGGVAYRVNATSALLGALTAGGVACCARLVSGRRWAALLAGLSLAVSSTLWSQSVIAEVYTTGTAFAVGVLLAMLYWDRTERPQALGVAGLLGGLSIGTHLTAALLAPAVLAYLVADRRAGRRAWGAALLGAGCGIALALGAYVAMDVYPSAADFTEIAIEPSRSVWGLSEADLDTPWERVWISLSGRQWQGRMYANPAETIPRNVGAYLGNLGNEFSWITLALAFLGGARLWVRRRAVAVLLGSALMVQWVYAFGYDIGDIYVFHLCGYAAIAVLSAAGAGALAELWARRAGRSIWSRIGGSGLAAALCLAAVLPVAAPYGGAVLSGTVPPFPFDGYPVQEGLDLMQVDLQLVVRRLEQGAAVFANWRRLYPYYYVSHVEGTRTDLRFYEEKPFRPGEGAEDSMVAFVDARYAEGPVYFERCLDELRVAGYACWPVSTGSRTLYRLRRSGPN